jgi:hypothetical protein
MVTANPMDEDDDVERLFSWLQTPELRYREFAGAREIADTVMTWQARPNTPPPANSAKGNTQLQEEYPPDQFPDQSGMPVEPISRMAVSAAPISRGPTTIVPTPMPLAEPAPAQAQAGPFALSAAGRGIPRRPEYAEPIATPVVQRPVPAPVAAAPPMPPAPRPAPPPPAPPPRPMVQPAPLPAPPGNPAGGHLLGGAYRGNGNGSESPLLSPESQERVERSLDAVFGRLAGGRNPLPDPRDRLQHISGLGPPAGRPR